MEIKFLDKQGLSTFLDASKQLFSKMFAAINHTHTKADIGLGNVENKSSATIRSELTKDNVTTALGYTPPTVNTTYNDATQSEHGLFSTDDKKKLDGIAEGANKIIVDSALNSTSSNPVQNKVIQSALNDKVPVTRTINGQTLSDNITLDADDVGAISTTQKGTNNGIAPLDENGKINATFLPSYVDDVLEGYMSDDLSTFYQDSNKSKAYTGESGKIYVDLVSNKTYRWSGTQYTVISETISLGETSTTAFDGARGKTAYDHSQSAHAPSNAERNIIIGIEANSTTLEVDSNRIVRIPIPTTTSELVNNSNYVKSNGTITYAKQLATARTIDGVSFDGRLDISHYGVCSTGARTVEKLVSVPGFELVVGAKVTVKFTVTNTASNPTLNVSGNGGKPIKYAGSAIAPSGLVANNVYEFVYDGTDYLCIGSQGSDIDVDSELSSTSSNPVQNKVVTSKITEKIESEVASDFAVAEEPAFLDSVEQLKKYANDTYQYANQAKSYAESAATYADIEFPTFAIDMLTGHLTCIQGKNVTVKLDENNHVIMEV